MSAWVTSAEDPSMPLTRCFIAASMCGAVPTEILQPRKVHPPQNEDGHIMQHLTHARHHGLFTYAVWALIACTLALLAGFSLV